MVKKDFRIITPGEQSQLVKGDKVAGYIGNTAVMVHLFIIFDSYRQIECP